MTLRFPESAIEQILSSVDIVEVLSDYLVLKKAGSNYKALCPFHRERSPSFTVSPKKQMFYCFGCQAGGNVFSFLMKHENMTFPEAVRALAEKTGVQLPEVSRDEDARTLSLLNLNGVATDYFHRCLVSEKAAEPAREYLERRKIQKETIELFRLGYALPGKGLLEELKRQNFSDTTIENSGLFSVDKSRVVLSRRVIFPIFSPQGKAIGFGARVLGSGEPKYINSPETPVYRKGDNLYGINLAKDGIRDAGRAIVVEGYFDMIRPYQHGIRNVVASSGTALTENQVSLLRRYTKEVVMVYDADVAGVQATLRGLDLFVENGFRVSVAALPQGEDPDSFIQKRGREAFQAGVQKAKNLLDYKLEILARKHDPLTVEGRVQIVNEMLPTISKIGNAVERSEYVKKLAECLSIDEEAVALELSKLMNKTRRRSVTPSDTESLTPLVVERTLLQLILEDGSLLKHVKDEIEPEDFSHCDYKEIIRGILMTGSSEPQKVASNLQDEKLSRVIAGLLVKPVPYTEKEEALRDCINKIKKQRLKRRRVEIQKLIEQKESEGDMEAVRSLLQEYQKLIRNQ